MADVVDVLLKMRGTQAFVAEAGTASKAVSGIGTASATSGAQATKAAGKHKKSGQALSVVGRKAGFLALGLGAIGAMSFKTAADFDKSMNVWAATTDATTGELKEARAEAIRLGNDAKLPGISARDAADAMNELAKAGFETVESQKAARGVLLLSQAAQTDSTQSTKILGRSLITFGKTASSATKFVDVLAAAAVSSSVDIQDIADGMSYVGTTAKTLGMDFTDAATGLAIMNDAGIVGAKAGATLNAMLLRLTPGTKSAKKEMKHLGLLTKEGNSRFFDAQGRFVGMQKASRIYTQATKRLNQEERIKSARIIFGERGMRGAITTLYKGEKRWNKYRKEVAKTGKASKMAAATAKGSAGAIDGLKNSWETFAISLGTVLAVGIVPVLRGLSKVLSWLTKYPKPVGIVVGLVFGLAAALWTLNAALKVWKLVKTLADAYKLQVLWTKILTAWNWLLAGSTWATLLPILLVIAAVALLAVGFYLLYKKSDRFRKLILGIWGWIKKNWPLLLAILIGPIGIAALLIIKNFDKIKKGVFAVKDAFVAAFGAVKDAITSAINWLIRGWNRLSFKIPGFDPPGPGPKFGGMTISVPKIAELAMGGVIRRGGLVEVGEQGRELVSLPAGASVAPLPAGMSVDAAFSSAQITTQVMLDRREIARAVGTYTADKLARR